MSSTRNLNTINDYKVKKQESVKLNDYMLYRGFSKNDNPSLCVLGSNSTMYAGQLSHNAIDIESTLRGIRSTNLEGPSFKAEPQLKNLPDVEYFTRTPTYIPQGYIHSTIERPLYLS
jgi:hypothetical protein